MAVKFNQIQIQKSSENNKNGYAKISCGLEVIPVKNPLRMSFI